MSRTSKRRGMPGAMRGLRASTVVGVVAVAVSFPWWIGHGPAPAVAAPRADSAAAEEPTRDVRSGPVPAAKRRLIVWSIAGGGEGLAVALNALGEADKARQHAEPGGLAGAAQKGGLNSKIQWIRLRDAPGADEAAGPPISLREILSELMRAAPVDGGQAWFRMRWGGVDGCEIDFKFASQSSLLGHWQSLFRRCKEAHPPEPLDSFLARHPGLGWLGGLRDDLRSEPGRVVIFGPGNSDAVPALWFFLQEVVGDGAGPTCPLVVSASATSTLLRQPIAREANGAAGPVFDPSWEGALARMAGFAEDDHTQANEADLDLVRVALRRIDKVSDRFLQFTRPGRDLAAQMTRQVVDIQGCRKVAIFYPDLAVADAAPAAPGGTPRDGSILSFLDAVIPLRLAAEGAAQPVAKAGGGPVHRLFGPTLRDDFRHSFGERGLKIWTVPIPSPALPKGVEKSGAWSDPGYRKRVLDDLRPTLRHFAHEGVEAVGVFGEPDIKIPILGFVREELPSAVLFTSDADYRLENPRPSAQARKSEDAPAASEPGGGGERASDYKLEGLLVVSSPAPPREWVQGQFLDLDPLSGPDNPTAFLPPIHTYYSYHIFWKLIELVRDGAVDANGFPLLREGRIHRGKADPDCPASCLECFLREPFREIGTPEQRDWDEQVEEDGEARMLVIREGLLQPLDGRGSWGRLALVAALGAAGAAVAGFIGVRRPASKNGLLVAAGVLAVAFSLVATGMSVDAGWFGQPISLDLWPNRHSVLPSVLLQVAACALMLSLPGRYRARLKDVMDQRSVHWEFGRGDAPPIDAELKRKLTATIRKWLAERVEPHLIDTPAEWWAFAVAGSAMALVDAAAGLPVRPGFTYASLVLFEAFVLTMVASTAYSYMRIGWSVRGLPAYLAEEGFPFAMLEVIEPEQIRRLGTLFVDSVASALYVLLLILASRLSALGMAHWRWEAWGVPYGVIFFGGWLAITAGYWLRCYLTLGRLIRDVKRSRLLELDTRRSNFLKAATEQSTPSDDLDKRLDAFEARRKDILAISERPWESNDSFRARIAFATAILPWLIPALLGTLGHAVTGPITQLIQGLSR